MAAACVISEAGSWVMEHNEMKSFTSAARGGEFCEAPGLGVLQIVLATLGTAFYFSITSVDVDGEPFAQTPRLTMSYAIIQKWRENFAKP